MLLLEAMRVSFSQQRNGIFHRLGSLEKLLDFHAMNYVFKSTIVLFPPYYLVKTILKAIILLFASNFFQQENLFLFTGTDLLKV